MTNAFSINDTKNSKKTKQDSQPNFPDEAYIFPLLVIKRSNKFKPEEVFIVN